MCRMFDKFEKTLLLVVFIVFSISYAIVFAVDASASSYETNIVIGGASILANIDNQWETSDSPCQGNRIC